MGDKNKTKFRKFFITLIILTTIVVGLFLFADWFSKTTGYAIGYNERSKTANCLFKIEAEFYGSPFCSECEAQKEVLGNSFSRIDYVDCGQNKELCPNIREIPAWYINKQIYYGTKSLSELKEIAGCST